MFRHNLPLKKISLLAATCGGLLVSLATLSQAGGPPPQQGKPVSQPAETPSETPAATEEPVSQPTPAASPGLSGVPSTPTDAPPRFPLPSARVTPAEGGIVIKLVNTTNAVINYQIVGVTPAAHSGRTIGNFASNPPSANHSHLPAPRRRIGAGSPPSNRDAGNVASQFRRDN
ncbi:hypothetical protein [Microcoleus vaginatus]|uniref:hypothetical protein n=1 Tax=Microcoleus vaginatus TaxID=119532 RepID=UPI00403F2A2F